MKILNNFYDERRQYEGRISSLEEEIASLKRELSAKTTNTKERENVVAIMRTRLVGVNRSRDLVHSCLKEACQSIKVALAMKVCVNCCRIYGHASFQFFLPVFFRGYKMIPFFHVFGKTR